MKRIVSWFLLSLGILLVFSACSSDKRNARKRAEYAQIVESRDAKDLLNDLYVGADGDIEALARILNCTPSTIDRIRKGQTVPSDQFEERIRTVSVYYFQNHRSFSKLRSVLDEKWNFCDSVLSFPKHHPVLFWTINIVLILLVAFVSAGIFIWPLLVELLFFLLVFLVSLFIRVKPIQDNYTESINPVIEQML